MAIYDKHYQEKDYFGRPYPELIKYFKSFDRKLKVLDLGCGQGRDTIGISRLGFQVTGVDISKVGIKQMMEVAKKEKLDINGVVSNLNEFDKINEYDVVLLDSMFHFYKNDVEHETKMLNRIINESKQNAYIVLIVQENKNTIKYIKEIFQSSEVKNVLVHEESFLYQEFKSMFHMQVYQLV